MHIINMPNTLRSSNMSSIRMLSTGMLNTSSPVFCIESALRFVGQDDLDPLSSPDER